MRRVVAPLLAALLVAGCTPPSPGGGPATTPTTPGSTATTGPVKTRTGPAASVPPAGDSGRVYTSPDRPDLPLPEVNLPGFASPPPGSGISRYLAQRPAWVSCDKGECASVLVPLDHAAPDGTAITLSLARVRATAPKLGTIFVNPGGPGEPSLWLAKGFRRKGLEAYDVVAWDPRGSGASTPVRCADGRAIDAYLALDASPDDQGEMDALLAGNKSFAASCAANSGKLLRHVSSVDTVADMDLLRRLLGEPKFNYLGYSYGTYLGALYAETYPANVGRMVFDSPVNITRDASISQANGFDTALGIFAKWCAEQKCSLGGTRAAVLESIVALFERLDASPAKAGGRRLTQSLAALGVAAFLYRSEAAFGALLTGIKEAQAGDGSSLLAAADRLEGRSSDGTYNALFAAFPAIGCADSLDSGIAGALQDWKSDQEKSPIFAKYLGPGLLCPIWPVRPGPEVRITAAGTPPILIVGATGDSATPYAYAVWMADQLSNAVLLTYSGEGHATYGMNKSACVDEAVSAYLASGALPPDDKVCAD